MADQQEPETFEQQFDLIADRYEALTGYATRALARYVVNLPQFTNTSPPPGDPSAVLLDNACGTGFIAEEVLRDQPQAYVQAVDVAQMMINMAKARLSAPNLTIGVMPGEKLEFADGTFTHSVTNLGMLFFKDPPEGAKEVYRTLRTGGTAIVTSWSRLGTVQDAMRPAQAQVRPNDPPVELPFAQTVPKEWFTPAGVEKCLKAGGFTDVEMLAHRVYYGCTTLEELSALVFDSFKDVLYGEWSEEEQKALKELVYANIKEKSHEYTMPSGKPGVGLPMDAIIAVCKK